jgi:flagellar protein FlaG
MINVSQSNGLTPASVVPDGRPPPASVPSAVAAAPVSVPAPAQVQQAVQMINKTMQTLSRNLEFSVDNAAVGKTVVKVVDNETGETIRQMPSQETLDIARALDRLQGLLIRRLA